jgi:hypothetical protein
MYLYLPCPPFLFVIKKTKTTRVYVIRLRPSTFKTIAHAVVAYGVKRIGLISLSTLTALTMDDGIRYTVNVY